MKQFFTAIAANFVTIAILVVFFFLLLIGIVASIGSGGTPDVAQGSVLVIDLDQPLVDAPAETRRRSTFDDALTGDQGGIPIRSALLAVRSAATDNRISGILIRGGVNGTGYAALRELREALHEFRSKSNKPVHAYLVNPETRDYYVASAATTVTMDPFGTLLMPGISAEAVFLSGFLEKYGIGVQVTRVGRFKAAVEPLTRTSMSPENRLQTQRYVGTLWSEVKSAIARDRGVDTLALQQVVDEKGLMLASEAHAAGLVDRVAYWDAVIDDLRAMSNTRRGRADTTRADTTRADTTRADTARADTARADTARAGTGRADTSTARNREFRSLPQISLADYAILSNIRRDPIGADLKVAVVYAAGDIVDGEGGTGLVGGDAVARDLRRVRLDNDIKAVVLRVNSPGGSAVASETMQRELALIARDKPVVVSMGSVAASGGYWIATAAQRIFVQPNTITGSIGVFGILPNVKTIANRHGITFDTVKTGRYADLFSITRPRTQAELAIVQRGVDAIYDAFIDRVARARSLPADSVRAIADGRVWSGEDAVRLGLADSVGGIDAAIRSAATLANITGDYRLDEYPRRKNTAELLSEMIDRKPPPVADAMLSNTGAAGDFARGLMKELRVLTSTSGVYARVPYLLFVR